MSVWLIDRDCFRFHNNDGNIDTDTDTYYDSCYHWYGNTTTPVATAASSVSVLRYRLRIGRATLRHLRLIYGPPHDDSYSVSVLSTVQPNDDWVHISIKFLPSILQVYYRYCYWFVPYPSILFLLWHVMMIIPVPTVYGPSYSTLCPIISNWFPWFHMIIMCVRVWNR